MLLGPGLVLIGLLITARTLEPSPDGFGTHRGLGLPSCSMIAWFGIRCPSCGMTTSWAYATRGDVLASLNANIGGFLLALGAAGLGPYLTISSLSGKWFLAPPNELYFALAGISIILITLIDWVTRHMYIT
ncbi:hypothetical protein Pla8534_57840 [Lignipirellula cremea]|uniref:DUF2752 domain-containing protein n=2 Tax=Lignipirellula cremea TaxID=2528010 RepID=A0A518E1F3_9BACT|nr:hypothetical protein Pla8534_57840 [Lignipirellula cremea]